MTDADDKAWDEFVADVRMNLIQKMVDSAMVMSLVPSEDFDVKFAVELGAAIMLDKPIVVVAIQGRDVPPGLRRVARAVIEAGDIDTEAGRMELERKLRPILDNLKEPK